MGSSRAKLRALPLYALPSPVHFAFCRVMDDLPDELWTNFASQILSEQTDMRLTKKKEHRTDTLMQQWQIKNGTVGQLLDLLQRLELLQPWDIINNWDSLPSPRVVPSLPVEAPWGYTPPQRALRTDPPVALPTCPFHHSQMAQLLPKPHPPELASAASAAASGLSSADTLPRPLLDSTVSLCTSGVMAWAYEEVHAGTCGFSAGCKVGEGGFGDVYRANLRNTDCAVKRFKQDSSLDLKVLRDSFQTEVEKLSKFRHPSIVDLLGYSDGGGTFCLIYSFMENGSLEYQLRSDGRGLSWAQRVAIGKGAASALQYLHCPPEGQEELVHGDVKSSNILLDRHLEAKLADFGLAQFVPRGSSGRTASQTCSFGNSQQVRGTEPYLPQEYLQGSRLDTKVDVYSFGVVLLEMLTGRRALDKDTRTGRESYLRELVSEVGEGEAEWRKHLDRRLLSGSAVEPSGFMQVVSLAQQCLNTFKKKRPSMTKVFESLCKLHVFLASPSSNPGSLPPVLDPSASTPVHPAPAHSLDSGLTALSLGPKASSMSPPKTLHSSTMAAVPLVASAEGQHGTLWSSLAGPCETDESRGYSQFHVSSNGEGSAGPCGCELKHLAQPSVPTEDQYNFPPSSLITGQSQAAALPQCTSLAESLQSHLPVVLNPSKQHLLQKKALYDLGHIHTLQLLSIDDQYSLRSPAESRLPEESDELDFTCLASSPN